MGRTLTTSGLMGDGNIENSSSLKVGTGDGEWGMQRIGWSKWGLQLRKQKTLVSRTGKEQEAMKGLTYK
jgi:hypothetical protein